MPKPAPDTYPSFFKKYVDTVAEDNLADAFAHQLPGLESFLEGISEEKANYAYAPGKWTIKELLQHVIDTERLFAYRALCFSRKEAASLPGFDEDAYAAHSNANARPWADLVAEFVAVRKSSEWLYTSFSEDMLTRSGIANNHPATVLSIGFMIVGHVNHHQRVLQERYLS